MRVHRAAASSRRRTHRRASAAGRRRSGSTATDVVNRTYTYATDGAASGYSSSLAADAPRSFVVDQANRLVCTTSLAGSGCSLGGSNLVDNITYDASDSRTAWSTWAFGANVFRSYSLVGNSLSHETWTGHDVAYTYPTTTGGGPRVTDDDSGWSGTADLRTWIHDAQGRLRGVVLQRPNATTGAQEQHTLGVFYDHLTRPFLVTDHNDTLNQQQNTGYYWDHDRLTGRIIVPLIGSRRATRWSGMLQWIRC